MGKPEKGPSSGQSIEQLLSSIRTAIEAGSDSAPAPASDAPAPGKVPRAPRVATSAPDQAGEPNKDSEQSSRYRYRYALANSKTYSGLKDRLSSLSERTRGQTSRSMASVLGGDDPQLKGSQEQDLASEDEACFTEQAEVEAQTGEELDLRSTFPPVAPDAQAGTHPDQHSADPQYQPHHHGHPEQPASMPPQEYAHPPQVPEAHPPVAQVPVEEQPVVLPGAELSPPVESYVPEAPAPEVPAPEIAQPQPAAEPAPEQGADPQLPLDMMIRQIIEPELYLWFDEHMPEHVARAMPDEDAFIAMIRPLIEEWLEENLSAIVETAVRDEIARITGLKR